MEYTRLAKVTSIFVTLVILTTVLFGWCSRIEISNIDTYTVKTNPIIQNSTVIKKNTGFTYYPQYNIPLSEDLQKHIYDLCVENDIYYCLVLAIIMTESSFDVNAVGDYGNSIGLMQIQPKWWQDEANELGVSIYEPYGNVEVGICILKECLKSTDYDVIKALKIYNSNNPNYPSNAYVNKVMKNMQEVEKLNEES